MAVPSFPPFLPSFLSAIFYRPIPNPFHLSVVFLIQTTHRVFLICPRTVLFVSNALWNRLKMTNANSFILSKNIWQIIHVWPFLSCPSTLSLPFSLVDRLFFVLLLASSIPFNYENVFHSYIYWIILLLHLKKELTSTSNSNIIPSILVVFEVAFQMLFF